jgi:hypothetical protein
MKKRLIYFFLILVSGIYSINSQEIIWDNGHHQIELHQHSDGFPVYILLIYEDDIKSISIIYYGADVRIVIASKDEIQRYDHSCNEKYSYVLQKNYGNNIIYTFIGNFREEAFYNSNLFEGLLFYEKYNLFYSAGLNYIWDDENLNDLWLIESWHIINGINPEYSYFRSIEGSVNIMESWQFADERNPEIINIYTGSTIEAIKEIIRMTNGNLK